MHREFGLSHIYIPISKKTIDVIRSAKIINLKQITTEIDRIKKHLKM